MNNTDNTVHLEYISPLGIKFLNFTESEGMSKDVSVMDTEQ